MTDADAPVRLRCSFCTKEVSDLGQLTAGVAGAAICDDCIKLCSEILADDPVRDEEPGTTLLNDLRPRAIKSYLDEHAVGQDRAKTVLAVAVYNHFKRLRAENDGSDEVELTKSNILVIGPTGSGKTLLARSIAKKLGVPFTMADATSLTEAGYVGEDVEGLIKNLWLAANRDPELAAKGVVCIDEVDKIGRSGGAAASTRDVGGEGVQQALLKIIESQKVSIPPDGNRNRPQQELIQIDTKNVLFICCGSFEGLEEIIARRLKKSVIGFGATTSGDLASRNEILRQVRSEDLAAYGLIPEFIGRLPVVVTLDDLDEAALVEILWRPKNALVKQYQRMFELEGVKLRFEDDALAHVVALAVKRKSGARGLRAIMEQVMLDIMFDLPTMEGVTEVVITAACAAGTAPPTLLRAAA